MQGVSGRAQGPMHGPVGVKGEPKGGPQGLHDGSSWLVGWLVGWFYKSVIAVSYTLIAIVNPYAPCCNQVVKMMLPPPMYRTEEEAAMDQDEVRGDRQGCCASLYFNPTSTNDVVTEVDWDHDDGLMCITLFKSQPCM